MRRKQGTPAEEKAIDISARLFSPGFKISPSMKRKVGDLALWLAAGDRSKVRRATLAVVDLLCAAARVPTSRLSLQDRSRTATRGDTGWW